MRFLDLFCGCGGLSKGLELAGHQCLLGVDCVPDAVETFAQNHPASASYTGQIEDLTEARLREFFDPKDVDMVVGGPPCQGFSTAGKGRPKDERNQLVFEFLRIVEICAPKVLIMENVPGLLAEKNAPILKGIFDEIERLGYWADARVLSFEEYGVPEMRRRMIIMGAKDDLGPLFPKMTHGERGESSVVTVGEAFEDLRAADGNLYNHDVEGARITNSETKKRIACIPEGRGVRYRTDEEKYLPEGLRFGVDWGAMPEGRFRQTKLQRLDRSSPAPTIMTSAYSYFHPVEDRYLTVREAAACQGFPNDFVFSGKRTSQFRQIGNAVPPILGKALGDSLKRRNHV